jgi:hypothetical protein
MKNMQIEASIMKEKEETPLQTGGIRCLKCKEKEVRKLLIFGEVKEIPI